MASPFSQVGARRVLLLAQTPPPHHGQSAVAARIHEILAAAPGLTVERRWRGGARSNRDIGRKSVGKLFGFAMLVGELAGLALTGRRYDIVYLGTAPWAHTVMRDAILAGLGKWLAARTLVHVHGDGLDRILTGGGLRNRLLRRLLRGTELIAITAGDAEDARQSGLFDRVTVLANCAPDPGEGGTAPNRTLSIACLGNLDPRKGVLDFVDVVARLAARGAQVQAVIVGGPTASLDAADLRERAAALGAGDCITVTGWVSEERKSALLARADVFLYLSRHDLAPVALIEALAHGCAPIVLDVGGVAQMVGPALAGNVIPADAPDS